MGNNTSIIVLVLYIYIAKCASLILRRKNLKQVKT